MSWGSQPRAGQVLLLVSQPLLAVFTLAVHLFGIASSSPKPEETRRSLQKEPPGKCRLGGEGLGVGRSVCLSGSRGSTGMGTQ